MSLQKRCKQMITELSIPVTAFCRKVNISASAYYAWHRGTMDFSATTLARIEEYLSRYGF